MKKKRKWIIIGVIGMIVLFLLVSRKSSGKGIHIVTIEKVENRDLVERVSANGEIKPKKNVNISTDVAGKILKIFVKEGDTVRAGDMLLKLDSEIYEANAQRDREIISSAEADMITQEANLKKADQYFKRRKQLYEEGMISKEQFEDARIQLEIAEATRQNNFHRIEQAKASLKSSMDSIGKTSISSPIDGIVTALQVEEGEVAIIGTMNNPGTVLMTIADLSIMEAEVRVDETDIVKVSLDKRAEVKVDALPDTMIKGIVTEVGNSALQTSSSSTSEARDFKTVITLIEPPSSLKPGFTATADIIIEEKKNVASIPIAALVLHEEKKEDSKEKQTQKEGVFVNQKGIAKFREVKKGISGDMHIEILSGLKSGDEIITGPFATLKKIKDGDAVKPETKKK